MSFTQSRKQAIITKATGQTEKRPARIKARATSGISRTYSRDALGDDPHAEAARRLAAVLGWPGNYRGAWINPDQQAFVEVSIQAAAPDMLAALKGILANFHESVTTTESLAEFPALQAVANAITQAEGTI